MTLRALFLGNGSHENRGCEAIDLGTLEVLRAAFGEVEAIVMPDTPGPVAFDALPEGVRATVLAPTGDYHGAPVRRVARALAKRLAPGPAVALLGLWMGRVRKIARDVDVALSLGGDNYTLDYGPPNGFWALDRAVVGAGTPLFLWGASVGPFDEDPAYERFAVHELSRVAGIFARETVCVEYLSRAGVTVPAHLVADPAFALEPSPVGADRLGFDLPEGAVGLNLSPLLARFRGECGDAWLAAATSIAAAVAERTDRPLVFVPHVVQASNDDHAFLTAVAEGLKGSAQVHVVPRALGAAELKGVIARLACFAGARMHATIAALSSGVPTVSLAYSAKARGVNRQVFGDERWVVDARSMGPETVAERISECLAEATAVRETLSDRVPSLREAAFSAGVLLREALVNRGAR